MEHISRTNGPDLLKIFLWLCLSAVHATIYDDPQSWPESDYFCGSCLQSPINVSPFNSEKVKLHDLVFQNYHVKHRYAELVNNGDTVTLDLDLTVNASISGGNFIGEFKADRIMFHWALAHNNGTEHAIKYRRYALEAQIIHRNYDYPENTIGLRGVNGYIILSVLFREVNDSDTVNQGIKDVCRDVWRVNSAGTYHFISKNFTLSNFMDGVDVKEYYTYCGSYPIPPCSPNVNWIVFPKPIDVEKWCLIAFRSVLTNDGRTMNVTRRDLFNAGHRKIFHHKG